MNKRKKTGRVKRWIRNWLSDYDTDPGLVPDPYAQNTQTSADLRSVGVELPGEFAAEGLNITIHNANGGYVASFRRYDRKTDQHSSQLYVITSDQKFEEALAHCIAMECLSR